MQRFFHDIARVLGTWTDGRLLAPTLCAVLLAACSSPAEEADKYYEKGLALLERGGKEDLVQADLEFRNALGIKKTLAPAIYGLALVAEQQGNLQRYFSYLNQAVEQDPNLFDAQVRLGKLLAGAGLTDRAQEACDQAAALRPDDPAVQVLQAAIHLKRGDPTQAVSLGEKLLAKDAGNTEVLELLAAARLAQGDAPQALALADRALAGRPDEQRLLILKLQILDKLGRSLEIEALMRRLVALQPDNAQYRNGLVQFLVRQGRKEDAEAELRSLAASHPQDTLAKVDVVRFVMAARGAAAARQELEAMIGREAGNNELKFALVALLQAQNDRPEAEKVIRAIMEQGGDSADGLKAKGLMAAHQLYDGKKDAAMALVGEILAKDPRNEQAMLIKASVDIDTGRLEQAVNDLRTVLREAPDSARALTLLGKAHELQGSAALAEEQYAQAFRVSRMELPYGLAYAEFLMRQSQSPRAEKLLLDLLKARPGSLPALKLLAQARSNQGNWAGAKAVEEEMRRLGG